MEILLIISQMLLILGIVRNFFIHSVGDYEKVSTSTKVADWMSFIGLVMIVLITK